MKKKQVGPIGPWVTTKSEEPATQQEWPDGQGSRTSNCSIYRAAESVMAAVEHFRGTIAIIFINVIKTVVLQDTRQRSRSAETRYVKGDMYPFILECARVAR